MRRSAMRKKRTYRSFRPCPSGRRTCLVVAICLGKLPLLGYGHTGEAVVRRITKDDEDWRILLYAPGALALFLQFGEG